MIVLTPNAIIKVQSLLKEESKYALRIGVTGGGCNGFNYTFAFAEEASDDDTLIEYKDVNVLVDPISLMYLDGAVVDYSKSIAGELFTVSNPNAATTCGCGTSFGV